MKRAALLLLVLAITACEFGVDQSTLVTPDYELLGECDRPDLAQASAIIADALCGEIIVPENPDDPDGRQIGLNVMLLPATTAVVKPDPIFFLAGGPGQSAIDAGVFVFSRLGEVRRERDVVLVDQRGTGGSNGLKCTFDEPEDGFRMTSEEALARSVEQMRDCLKDLDAAPQYYTTPIAMDDLNQVRQQLGYRDINLLGGSYGTRAGLVYMRQHGETVRSAVLDGLAPTTMRVPANIAIDADTAFQKILGDCESQEYCKSAFPDLRVHFNELMTRLAEPETISIVHSRTGETVEGYIDARAVNGILRTVLYDRVLSTLVPLAIEEAYQGNYQPLYSLALVFIPEEPIINLGMMASVLCAEDMQMTESGNPTDHFGNQIYDLLEPVCKFWPKGEIPESYFQPVSSDVPTLLLSGALDPVTPPKYAWQAAETLSNAEHIVVSGVGHGVTNQGCMPGVIAEFFDTPVPGEVNAGCTSNLGRKAFFTSFAGPVPVPPKAPESDDD